MLGQDLTHVRTNIMYSAVHVALAGITRSVQSTMAWRNSYHDLMTRQQRGTPACQPSQPVKIARVMTGDQPYWHIYVLYCVK